MIFSKTQEYALQALILLASTPGAFHLNRDVAEQLGVPGPYLAKVLKRFAKLGYLDSAKGRGGGFKVRNRALAAPISEVLRVADGTDPFTGCLAGLPKCTDRTACPLHEKWMPIQAKVAALLDEQTVADLAAKARRGRTRLAPARKAAPKR